MSAEAGAAVRAVLAEVGALGQLGAWGPLNGLLHAGGGSDAIGAAAAHSAAARDEAVRKLIGNHTAVLRDVANPSADKNIIGVPLTQLKLKRVAAEDAFYVDQAL
eukprot:5220774-Prymnesium_polylepis.1